MKRIRLNESQFNNLVSKCVKRVIKEEFDKQQFAKDTEMLDKALQLGKQKGLLDYYEIQSQINDGQMPRVVLHLKNDEIFYRLAEIDEEIFNDANFESCDDGDTNYGYIYFALGQDWEDASCSIWCPYADELASSLANDFDLV